MKKKILTPYNILVLFTIALLFVLCFSTSLLLNINQAPDEYMRIQIPNFIFRHGNLPIGDEQELLEGNIFGFSYGFSPYLPSLFSALFMKITSFFTTSQYALLVAARFINVICGVAIFPVCLLLGNELFKNKKPSYAFACLCSFLPQMIFMSGYLNNDSPSVLATALIVVFWLKGFNSYWNFKSCIGLGASAGALALTYYTAYGFILCSIIVFFISCCKMKLNMKLILKKVAIIIIAGIMIGGWFFIRNAVIHNGDFLGMNAMYSSGEKYGIDEWKPSKRENPNNQHKSLFETFTELKIPSNENWFESTYKSFIGKFGYMSYDLPSLIYQFYFWFMLLNCIVAFITMILEYKQKNWQTNLIFINFLICIIVPFVLSMYYTYMIDYQAQGRYVISILIPTMFFTIYGIQFILNKLHIKLIMKNIFWITIPIISILISLYSYLYVLAPNCFLK